MKESKMEIINKLFPIFLFCLLLERFYVPESMPTGSLNRFVVLFCFLMSILYYIYNKKIVSVLETGTIFGISLYVFFWKFADGNTLIYASLIVILYLIRDIKIGHPEVFFGSVTLTGSVLSVIQHFQGMERTTGFLASSPTIFSYIMLVAMAYFSLAHTLNKKSMLLQFVSVLSIYYTGSRSTLLCSLLLAGYTLFQLYKRQNRKIKIAIPVLIGVIALFILCFNAQMLTNMTVREGAEYSTQARKHVIDYFIGELTNNKVLLIGQGGGYTSYMTPKILNLPFEDYPLHQDLLMWVVEYGIIGVILLFTVGLVINRSIKLESYMKIGLLMVFLVGTFHNLFISPISFILLKILYNSLESNIELND